MSGGCAQPQPPHSGAVRWGIRTHQPPTWRAAACTCRRAVRPAAAACATDGGWLAGWLAGPSGRIIAGRRMAMGERAAAAGVLGKQERFERQAACRRARLAVGGLACRMLACMHALYTQYAASSGARAARLAPCIRAFFATLMWHGTNAPNLRALNQQGGTHYKRCSSMVNMGRRGSLPNACIQAHAIAPWPMHKQGSVLQPRGPLCPLALLLCCLKAGALSPPVATTKQLQSYLPRWLCTAPTPYCGQVMAQQSTY